VYFGLHGYKKLGFICSSSPKPNRKAQLMTDVKCGTQLHPENICVLNKVMILGTLRNDTTALDFIGNLPAVVGKTTC
jgi:hypothetical protein